MTRENEMGNLQKERAEKFAGLHIKGDPVILFNIWDAGSAKAIADAGAKAIATGSHSVAAANGYGDGQNLPMEDALANVARIISSVDLPVTLDFEGGYAEEPAQLKKNILRVIETGAVGINFEDQVVGGDGLYSIEQQSERIAAVREAADSTGIPLFINARTDVFLKAMPGPHTTDQVEEALDRGESYARAGASGLFAPGLYDAELIGTLCQRSSLPVNIMVMGNTPSNSEMAALGVARISYGPGPYRQMVQWLTEAGRAAFAGLT